MGACLSGICAGDVVEVKTNVSSEEFRRRLEILNDVPLFRRLPRSQYPILAQVMKVRRWKEGATVLDFNAETTEFFIIAQGSAEARIQEEDMVVAEPLRVGDYFGEKSLESGANRVSPVKIVANMSLVTLSLTAEAFDKAGLRQALHIPRRRAIGEHPVRKHEHNFTAAASAAKTPEDREFIGKALRANDNLRSLVKLNKEIVEKVCDIAVKEHVKKGMKLVERGQFSKVFYIVASGKFKLHVDADEEEQATLTKNRRSSSADIMKMVGEMRKRLGRKEEILLALTHAASASTNDVFGRDQEMRQSQARDRGSTETWSAFSWRSTYSNPGNQRGQDAHMTVLDEEPLLPEEDGCFKRASAPEMPEPGHQDLIEEEDLRMGKSGTSKPRKKKKFISCVDPKRMESLTRDALDSIKLNEKIQGESFGEVSLLYNAPHTSTAVAVEDSEVWCVSQAAFRRIMLGEKNKKVDQIVSVLEQVDVLQGLLSHEKEVIAKNFLTISFGVGDYIVRQGETLHLWYIVVQGEVKLSRLVGDVQEDLATLRLPQYFGERALLRDSPSDFSVKVTSQEGARCLVLDCQTFKDLIESLTSNDPAFRHALDDDWETFAKYKARASSGDLKAKGVVSKLKEAALSKSMDEIVQRRSSRAFSSDMRVVLDPEVCKRTFQRVGVLGSGAFGLVTLERDPTTQELYALKTLSKAHIQQCEAQDNVLAEREILNMIDSPFIVRMFATWKDKTYIYFVFEPCLGGELHTLLHKNPAFRNTKVSRFAIACLVPALMHVHERQIIFRDLKPENILMGSNGYCKLCDFGFAKFVTAKTLTICGTPDYIAPEVLEQQGYDRLVDWWALGVLSFELLAFRTPFGDTDDEDETIGIFKNIREGIGCVDFPFERKERDAADMVRKLLDPRPGCRLGAGGGQQVMRHSFLASIDFQELCLQRLPSPYVPDLKGDDDLSHFNFEADEPVPSSLHAYEDDGSNWDAPFGDND